VFLSTLTCAVSILELDFPKLKYFEQNLGFIEISYSKTSITRLLDNKILVNPVAGQKNQTVPATNPLLCQPIPLFNTVIIEKSELDQRRKIQHDGSLLNLTKRRKVN
jgi:hypothetical protein